MTEQVSPLRQRMIDDMKIRNMSPNTQRASSVLQLARRQVAGQADIRARARVSTSPRRARAASRHQWRPRFGTTSWAYLRRGPFFQLFKRSRNA